MALGVANRPVGGGSTGAGYQGGGRYGASRGATPASPRWTGQTEAQRAASNTPEQAQAVGPPMPGESDAQWYARLEATPKYSAADLAAGNQFNNAYGYFSSLYGYDPSTGTTAAGADALGRYQGNMEMTLANRNYQGGLLRQDNLLNLAQLGLQRKGTAQEQAALGRQLGEIAQRLGLAGQERDLTKEGSWADAATSERGVLSSVAARGGAVATQGTRSNMGDIAGLLSRQLRGADLQYKGAELSASEQRAQVRDRQNALKLASSGYGISEQQLKNDLERGLQKLNIDAYVDVNSIMDKMNSTKAEDRMMAEQIIRSAMQYSEQFPSTAPMRPTNSRVPSGTSSSSGRAGYR